MATRIFLAMGSLLIREIRRSGVWHFWQTVSTPKTRRSKSDPEVLAAHNGIVFVGRWFTHIGQDVVAGFARLSAP